MSGRFDQRGALQRPDAGSTTGDLGPPGKSTLTAGKRTLAEQLPPIQRLASPPSGSNADGEAVRHAAAQGVAGAGGPLPHGDAIQRLFGRHDIGGIEAHVGGPAAAASRAIGAEAYAAGHHIAFASAPSLHTAAHEAAHVVQQRGGVQLKGGVGQSGDEYEQHADRVADAVVRGESAEDLLDRHASGAAHCASCGGTSESGEVCASCAAAAGKAGHGPVQRSPAPARGSTNEAVGPGLPRSLNQSLAPASLSDDELAAEIDAIRAWFASQATSSKESEALALALGQLAHEVVKRHPGPSMPTTTPRPAGSITPSDVLRANAGARPGTGMGVAMAVPGLVPTPAPPPMPPPIPMPPPVTPAPPVAAPPVPMPPVVEPPVTAAPKPLPITPLAAGVFVFLLILLWPNDSIESGPEERRKLDENQRRQRQQPPGQPRAAAEPVPGSTPTPVPSPPLGDAPHERRRPEQTCENLVLDAMQREMHNVCDQIPGESCSPKKVSPKKLARRPCSQIRLRINAVRECIRQRQRIQDECFGGAPDLRTRTCCPSCRAAWRLALLSRRSTAPLTTRWRVYE